MKTAEAKLRERDGRPALRFERVLRHPPERVWRALVDHERQLGWHPTPARFELEVGGRVEYLEEVLTHTFGERDTAADYAAGWHICLDSLPSALDGSTKRPEADTHGPALARTERPLRAELRDRPGGGEAAGRCAGRGIGESTIGRLGPRSGVAT